MVLSVSFQGVAEKPPVEIPKIFSPAPFLRPFNPDSLELIPSGMPVDSPRITSVFGWRTHPILGKVKPHKGVDFSGEVGDTIRATMDGIVETNHVPGKKSTYGYHVRIDHLGSYETLYAHMSRVLVSPGDTVEMGQPIGLIGDTGRSHGSHLHYEVFRDGKQIDPQDVMKRKGNS